MLLKSKPIVDLQGGVWKKALKQGRHKGKGYPRIIHCRKCRKRILNNTWFYAKITGGKNQYRTEYYCDSCYEGLWHE